jgi:nitrate reductase gamma subunit
MKVLISAGFVALLCVISYFAAMQQMYFLLGILLPYTALTVFVVGFIFRLYLWAKTPVPFNITTTAGQQKSLPWIKQNHLENPANTFDVILRMLLEVLVFRSLFRNNRGILVKDRLIYDSNKFLWSFGLIFHWSFLFVVVRHIRFFMNPPSFLFLIENVDSMMQIGAPALYITDVLFVAGVSYLFIRRIIQADLRYFSLVADYFPLLLIGAIAATGILLRYVVRVDVMDVKKVAEGLVTFNPISSGVTQPFFYVHLSLVCSLFLYFPFSKLMHMGGIFMSPTRNMSNQGRSKRHINEWNPEIKIHSYEDYENDFREKMKEVGLPVEKE